MNPSTGPPNTFLAADVDFAGEAAGVETDVGPLERVLGVLRLSRTERQDGDAERSRRQKKNVSYDPLL